MVDFTNLGEPFPGGFRVDLLLEDRLVVEVKAVETLSPVAARQVLTYLRLMSLPLGLVINFGGARFKGGVQRVENRRVQACPIVLVRPAPDDAGPTHSATAASTSERRRN